MEENPVISMARTWKIIRRSVHKFLQHYEYFTLITSFIALPFSISILISQSLIPRARPFYLLQPINTRLHLLFEAAGFPPASEFFALITLKLSQTITSSIITFPFAISFLLLAKASTIKKLQTKPSPNSSISLYTPLLCTHICNSFIVFSANATCFSILFVAFNFLEGLHVASSNWVILFSALAAVFYSIVIANTLVVCNLALVCSGMEGQRGFESILRACVMIKGRTSTALGLAVPINLGLAALEALFHFRITTTHIDRTTSSQPWLLGLEGGLIGYLYSTLLVLDVIMSCLFYRSCKSHCLVSQRDDQEELYCYDDGYCNVEKLKGVEGFV